VFTVVPVRAAPIAFAALVATVTLSTGAFPGPRMQGLASGPGLNAKVAAGMGIGPAALRFGRSLGSPTQGRLIGGMHLTESEFLRIVPADAAGDVRWGLEPLVAMLDRAARLVKKQFPDAVESVGHLSREGGGDVDQHRSHESGRDADVGFYIRSFSGRPLLPSHFVTFRGDGTAATWPGAYFDDARNWALVAALLGDPQARVTHLFVASPLRARLLAYAERTGAPTHLRLRAAELMQQPHGTLPHDDHFHVRIACPAHMTGCVENPAPRIVHARVSPPSHPPRPVSPLGTRSSRDADTPPPHALITAAPKHTPGPSHAPAPEPTPAPPDTTSPPTDDAPPASIATPVDDVDG